MKSVYDTGNLVITEEYKAFIKKLYFIVTSHVHVHQIEDF